MAAWGYSARPGRCCLLYQVPALAEAKLNQQQRSFLLGVLCFLLLSMHCCCSYSAVSIAAENMRVQLLVDTWDGA